MMNKNNSFYNFNELHRIGQFFRQTWRTNRFYQNTKHKIINMNHLYPLVLRYPEKYYDTIKVEYEKNNKRKYDPFKYFYICDYCEIQNIDGQIIYSHLMKSGHASFSLYGIDSDMHCWLIKPFYYMNLNGANEMSHVFVCPSCKIIFPNKYFCGIHVQLSHKIPTQIYARHKISISRLILKEENYNCKVCKSKNFCNFNGLVQHWRCRNFACCSLFWNTDLYSFNCYVIRCPVCFAYTRDRHDKTEFDLPKIKQFLLNHSCLFETTKNKTASCVIIMKYNIKPKSSKGIKTRKIFEIFNKNSIDNILYRLRICDETFDYLQNDFECNFQYLEDLKNESENLRNMINEKLSENLTKW